MSNIIKIGNRDQVAKGALIIGPRGKDTKDTKEEAMDRLGDTKEVGVTTKEEETARPMVEGHHNHHHSRINRPNRLRRIT